MTDQRDQASKPKANKSEASKPEANKSEPNKSEANKSGAFKSRANQPNRKSMAGESGPGTTRNYASPACALHELDNDLAEGKSMPSWESVNGWRKQHRKRLLDLRESLSNTQHKAKDGEIIQHLEASGWLNKQANIAFYWPMPGEIDLRPLMTRLVEQGVTAALPVIRERNQPLEFWQWTPGESLCEDGLWGIPTPAKRQLVDVGLLLVPMLGFDDDGHRMGFGGGYYDRTIAAMQPAPVCIGVCYEAGHMHSIYPQDHDMPMHAIASEDRMWVFSRPD